MLVGDLKSMTAEEIVAVIDELGLPKFRARQLFDWLQKGVDSFEQMSNLPASMIEALRSKGYYVSFAEIEHKFESEIDGTVKYLYRLSDGELIESVVMEYKHGRSICVSTQAGCRMGCKFCASTIEGRRRNLTAGEILSQIYTAQRDLGVRISNVVLMGMGEPLDNFDNTVRFLQLVSFEGGLNIGMRHISLSTCGLVDKIGELEKLNLQLTLSISLHAPTNELRDTIMPVNQKWRLEQLIAACKSYINATGRRISFEYALIKGFNDTDECAQQLKQLLSGMLCHVNLIPANPVHKDKFEQPDRGSVYAFEKKLCDLGLNATVRRTLGADISASCGQLRAKHTDAEKNTDNA